MPKLLLPFDGSESALRAVRHAISIALYFGDISVHIATADGEQREPIAPVVPNSLDARAQGMADAIPVAQAERLLRDAGVPCVREPLHGWCADAIARRADEVRCDGIVMGTRANSDRQDRGLGRVQAGVVDLAQVPVTFVR